MNLFWKRAIFGSSVVALIAIISVVTIAWLRRPRVAAKPMGPPAPLLYSEEDGSIYDLHLKMSQLEERLLAGEQRGQQLEAEITRVRGERDALSGQVKDLERQIARLRRKVEEEAAARQQPRARPEQAPNAPANTPANAPESSPTTEQTPPTETTTP